LAVLPSEALHNLQDDMIMKLRACEQCTLQGISEKKVKKSQMMVQRDSTVNLIKAIRDKNERTTKLVAEACKSILELAIPNDEPVDVQNRKLTAKVYDARIEFAKV